jgi:hypothetical protein
MFEIRVVCPSSAGEDSVGNIAEEQEVALIECG